MIGQADDESDVHSGALICQALYILQALSDCYSCKRDTRLFAAMALPPFSLEGDQDEVMDDGGAMLSELTGLPTALEESIRAITGDLFRPDYSRTVDMMYWMNHCEHCDATQGDFFVHGPNGPFWPYDPAGMDAIQVTRIEGPFRLPDANTSYSGAMADWRDRRHGVQRPPPPAPKKRKARAKKSR